MANKDFDVTHFSTERRFGMTRGLSLAALMLGTFLAAPAHAQEQPDEALGLTPGFPQTDALPGGTQPAFHQKSSAAADWRFDFHGFFTAPLRVGLNKRENPTPDQSKIVLHSPPIVPDDLETFEHTGVTPTPYAQLNFTYGNNVVTGNVFLLARVANVATGYFEPSAQLGVNDVFLNFNLPNIGKDMHFEVNLGQFSNRYGVMGEYDEGRYGTPIIARTNGAGENIIGRFKLGDVTLLVEQGFQGQSDKAPTGIVSDGWNGFADPNVGTSYVNHVHVGAGFFGKATVGLHYLNAFANDDRATGPLNPDGKINIVGGDLRLTLGKLGHLYAAASYVDAKAARSVGRIVQVLNTNGGPGLRDNYFGELGNGTGKLTIVGGQYDLSLARLLRADNFSGNGPDIFLSAFGMLVKVKTDEPNLPATRVKFGAQGAYSILPWLAAGVRYDNVQPDTKYQAYSFGVLSPHMIFRTGWQAHDQVTLQYSHYFNGKFTTVRSGYPPKPDITVVPDEDVLSLSASMWW
jgi:hypothetical protein